MKIQFNGLFHGFRWSPRDKRFELRYRFAQTRCNYHVLLFDGNWCVHGETTRDIFKFDSRDAAIAYAKAMAMKERTEVLIHTADGSIETCWSASIDAYPQEHLKSPLEYPSEIDPGKTVL